MCGSLRKIRPWKEAVLTDGKGHVLIENNLLPTFEIELLPTFEIELLPLHIVLVVVGFIVVLLIDKHAQKMAQ